MVPRSIIIFLVSLCAIAVSSACAEDIVVNVAGGRGSTSSTPFAVPAGFYLMTISQPSSDELQGGSINLIDAETKSHFARYSSAGCSPSCTTEAGAVMPFTGIFKLNVKTDAKNWSLSIQLTPADRPEDSQVASVGLAGIYSGALRVRASRSTIPTSKVPRVGQRRYVIIDVRGNNDTVSYLAGNGLFTDLNSSKIADNRLISTYTSNAEGDLKGCTFTPRMVLTAINPTKGSITYSERISCRGKKTSTVTWKAALRRE